MKLSNFQMAVILASVVAVIAIIAGLVLVDKDPAAVSYLVLALLPSTIATLIGVRASQQAKEKAGGPVEEPPHPRHLDDPR
jgi:uncharacterized Tic20 family protein